jgi:hypothetical protein
MLAVFKVSLFHLFTPDKISAYNAMHLVVRPSVISSVYFKPLEDNWNVLGEMC